MKAPGMLEAVTSGLPGAWSRDAVRARLPEDWRLVHGPAAQSDLAGGVVLSVGADGPREEHAGARVVVDPARLASGAGDRARFLEALVAELGDVLVRDCEAKARR